MLSNSSSNNNKFNTQTNPLSIPLSSIPVSNLQEDNTPTKLKNRGNYELNRSNPLEEGEADDIIEQKINKREFIDNIMNERKANQNAHTTKSLHKINPNNISKFTGKSNNKSIDFQSDDDHLRNSPSRIRDSPSRIRDSPSRIRDKSRDSGSKLSPRSRNDIISPSDLEALSYELYRDYHTLKVSNGENFINRMKFDILKRQTKFERINKILEQKKANGELELERNEYEQSSIINRSPKKIQEKLNDTKNVSSLTMMRKTHSVQWDEIYRDRFMRFESDKQRKIRERQREKQEIEKQEEEIIVRGIRSTSKVVSRGVAEQSGKRLFNEAEKREFRHKSKVEKADRFLSKNIKPTNIVQNEIEKFKKYKKNQVYRFQDNENEKGSNQSINYQMNDKSINDIPERDSNQCDKSNLSRSHNLNNENQNSQTVNRVSNQDNNNNDYNTQEIQNSNKISQDDYENQQNYENDINNNSGDGERKNNRQEKKDFIEERLSQEEKKHKNKIKIYNEEYRQYEKNIHRELINNHFSQNKTTQGQGQGQGLGLGQARQNSNNKLNDVDNQIKYTDMIKGPYNEAINGYNPQMNFQLNKSPSSQSQSQSQSQAYDSKQLMRIESNYIDPMDCDKMKKSPPTPITLQKPYQSPVAVQSNRTSKKKY